MTCKKLAAIVIPSIALALGSAGRAHANLVSNPGFETTTSGPGQMGYNTNATGWTVASGSYNFIFASGTADTTGFERPIWQRPALGTTQRLGQWPAGQ